MQHRGAWAGYGVRTLARAPCGARRTERSNGPQAVAGVIVLSCFGLLFSTAISAAERLLLAWR
ncbi:MAG: hypothetical protein F9K44_16240 [Hyphomicrobiaceae bacterium]|nr:MAG: hypothetical protein F9K44_16240 [Hyphomicrobiaceae bacterium]